MSDSAAALTYYSLMSLFPALLFAVAVLGVFGQESLITDTADYLKTAGAPDGDRQRGDVRARLGAGSSRSTAVTALVLGLALSLYSASGAFGAVGPRAQPRLARRGGARPRAPQGGRPALDARRARARADHVRAGLPRRRARLRRARAGSGSARPPRTCGGSCAGRRRSSSAMLVYAVVYYAAPNVEVRRFQWITPGAVFGVAHAGSSRPALFFVYVSNFSSYSATYGAFAGAVILLVWLWLTNVVLLFGAELNAAIDVRRSPELPERLRRARRCRPRCRPSLVGRLGRPQRHAPPAMSTAPRRPGHSPHSSRCGLLGDRPALGEHARRRGRAARRRARARRPA